VSTGIPADLKPHFDRLHDDVVMLCVRWQMYRQLYATSRQRVDLLNAVAGNFFTVIQIAMLDNLIIGISRITEKTATTRKENLVIGLLLKRLDEADNNALIARLREKLETVETTSTPIRTVRHKRIAHRDLQTALFHHSNPLPIISQKEIEDALAAIFDFMNTFQYHFTHTEISYKSTIPAQGDGNDLAHSLRRAVEHSLLERDGRVPPVGELSAKYDELTKMS
jgi:hypothetical protein